MRRGALSKNCSVKIGSRILTTRLQQQISTIVDIDQTGFIRGRSILKNFVMATELVQCCHKRRAPTLVLKLDFAKAFDSVDWIGLDHVLYTRGFPEQWRGWVQTMLSTSKFAVLVNVVPGPWFSCRRELRQGDPLSPYLFLIVADILQQLLKADGGPRHALNEDLPCSVL